MELIIFDWDGVLLDSLEAVHNAEVNICKKYGKKYPYKNAGELAKHYEEPYTKFYEKLGFDWEKDKEDIKRAFSEAYSKEKVVLYKGIKDMLVKLSSKYRLAIASQGMTAMVKKKVKLLGITHFFDEILGNDGYFGLKPEPDILHAVLHKTSLKENDAVYVGDLITDVKAAKSANMRSVAVTWGFNSREKLEKEKPDFIADSIEELHDILMGLD